MPICGVDEVLAVGGRDKLKRNVQLQGTSYEVVMG